MSKHTSYRGATIDMDTVRRENEKTIALGNMGVNARGDRVEHGVITKTADQLARENHRIPTAILKTSLKPSIEEQQEAFAEINKPVTKVTKEKIVRKEKELPNGDLVEDND
jgi:hypothetical protein